MNTLPEQAGRPTEQDAREYDASARVKLVKIGRSAWLHLKGLLLVFEGPIVLAEEPFSIAPEGTIHVPVEQVVILPPGRRVTGAQLRRWGIPVGLLGLLTFGFVLDYFAGEGKDPMPCIVLGAFLFIFLALAIRVWVKGKPTGRLVLGPEGRLLEFWYRPGSNKHKDVDAFFVQLRGLQQQVVEPASVAPLTRFGTSEWGARKARPAETLLGYMIACAGVGLVLASQFGSVYPLLLAVVPVVAFPFWLLVRRMQSKDMRMARSHLERGEDDAAAACLRTLLSKRPRHRAAWRMLVEYHADRKEYGSAFECCDAMQELGMKEAERNRGYVTQLKELDERRRGAGLRGADESPPYDAGESGQARGSQAQS